MKIPLEESEISFKTRDGLSLRARFWSRQGPRRPLIVMAPGFAQHSGTPIMRRCSEILADYGEVLCVNFRGTGGNPGRYGFGSEEHLDLEAALKWAKRRNKEVWLIGFSMGAYISLRAAVAWPKLVSRLYLVSAPTCIEDIVLTLGPLRQSVFFATHWGALKLRLWAGSNIFFRWAWPLGPKPRGEALAPSLAMPVAFLAGSDDQLVLPILSWRLYHAAKSQKRWTELAGGHHAEHMAIEREAEFRAWFKGQDGGARA